MLREKLVSIIHGAATGPSRTRILLTPFGPLFFFGLLGLLVFLSLKADRWLHLPPYPGPPANVLLGVSLTGAGTFLSGWSVLTFFTKRGTPVPFNPPPVLVTTGPYAYTRNPMLGGIFLLLFGVGSYLGSLSLLFFFTPSFILIMIWELKAVEEPELEKRLGPDYADYRKRVPMFFPKVRK